MDVTDYLPVGLQKQSTNIFIHSSAINCLHGFKVNKSISFKLHESLQLLQSELTARKNLEHSGPCCSLDHWLGAFIGERALVGLCISKTSNLVCRLCSQPITFNNKHINQRTDKKILLDLDTHETHDCQHEQRRQIQRRYYQCRKVVARKSILTTTSGLKAANGSIYRIITSFSSSSSPPREIISRTVDSVI